MNVLQSKLSPKELKTWMDEKKSFRLIDVREAEEWAHGFIPTAEWRPMSRFMEEGLKDLDQEESLVIYCHHGIRSLYVQKFLQDHGFANTWNLTGGIDAWERAGY